MHIGVDNLNVVNHVSNLIANRWAGRPFPLVNGGDLLISVQRMVRGRGRGNTLVTEVKGHADEGVVALGRVREVDRTGNNEAEAAADMGRRRVHGSITDARRLVNAACARWYPVVKELQHFFVAIARTVVNHDGSGRVLPCILLCGLALLIPREGGFTERFGIWPGYLVLSPFFGLLFWRSPPRAEVTAADFQALPSSVGLLVKVSHFLASLHWPVGAGERLVLEKVLPYGRRAGRPINFSAVPVGPGIDIWRSCRFIGSIVQLLNRLPGGLRSFIPCKIGANHCRLRHIRLEKSGQGLASRPLETSEPGFFDALLQVFGYPGGSGALLLSGELPLRCCSDRFAQRKPCLGLPERGRVHSLLTPAGEGVGLLEVSPVVPSGSSCWIRGAGGVWKRMRLTRKTNSSQLRRSGIPLSCTAGGGSDFVLLGRSMVSMERGGVPRSGVGSLTWVVCTVPRLQVCARRFWRK